jgi:hypothetical protein
VRLKSIIFTAVVALAVVAAFALAQQVRDGSTTPTPAISYWPMGGTDGTTNRVIKLDSNGILRTTEEYPYQYQTETAVICGAKPVTRGLKFMGFWYCAPFGQRTLTVTRTIPAATTNVDCVELYLFGGDDNLTFYPVIQSAAWSDGTTAGAADSLLVDTLRVSLPSRATTVKLTLPDDVYVGRYLAIYAIRDSSAVLSAQNIAITAEGRMY